MKPPSLHLPTSPPVSSTGGLACARCQVASGEVPPRTRGDVTDHLHHQHDGAVVQLNCGLADDQVC